MTQNRKFEWNPEDIFEITGAELEAMLRLGDINTIAYGNLTDEIKWKVYGKFIDAKTSILERFVEKGNVKVTDEEPAIESFKGPVEISSEDFVEPLEVTSVETQ